MKLLLLSLFAACALAAGSCPNPKDMNEQHDMNYQGKVVDFEKPIPIPAPVPDKTPAAPACSLFGDDLEVHEIFQRDSDKPNGEGPGGWSCRVDNLSSKNYVVRVQSTTNHRNPFLEEAWDFYYYAPAGSRTLANPGHGGEKLVCRLCGAAEANQEYLKVAEKGRTSDWDDMGPLEWSTYNFQCRRRCSVVLYQHRNFNGKSLTVSSNTPSLEKGELINDNGVPLVSSLKIFGKGCQVRLWENANYTASVPTANNKDDTPDPVCEITSSNDIEAWDMDALRKRCCNARCKSGQDCFKSVGIRDLKKCGPAPFSTDGKPLGCPQCHVSTRNTIAAAAATVRAQSQSASRVENLERLFKAMAEVLEE